MRSNLEKNHHKKGLAWNNLPTSASWDAGITAVNQPHLAQLLRFYLHKIISKNF
jgi:hypothetical protein